MFTLLAPLIIFLCFPGCFLFGGVLIVLLWDVWSERKAGAWLGYAVLVLVVFGAFTILALGPVRAQRCDDMAACWEHQFPRWDQPWSVPGWMLFSTLDIFRYCFKPFGHVLAVFAVVGGVLWWRSRQRALLVLLTLPLGLALVAAFVHAYPYGGARVEVYAAPALALLIAAGIPPMLAWVQARAATWRPPALGLARLVAVVFFLIPLAIALYRAAVPWARLCGGGGLHPGASPNGRRDHHQPLGVSLLLPARRAAAAPHRRHEIRFVRPPVGGRDRRGLSRPARPHRQRAARHLAHSRPPRIHAD